MAAADLLIVLGVAAAYVYSAISVVRGAGHVYFEVGCAVLVMVTIGRWLEATGKLRTTAALDALEKLLARARPHDRRQRQSARHGARRDVVPGDLLRVLAGRTNRHRWPRRAGAGERLGAIADRRKSPGDQATRRSGARRRLEPGWRIGGARNGGSAGEGSLARLIELVRAARLTKGRYQRLADRVSGWFLRGVLVVACGTFVFHSWRSGVDAALMAALAVLLIACPCALGLATPMAVWTALGNAARHGVLFRHGESLERLAEVRAVRFDKTGTLTTGEPRVECFALAAFADPDSVRAARRGWPKPRRMCFRKRSRVISSRWPQAGDQRDAGDISAVAGQGMAGRFDGEAGHDSTGKLALAARIGAGGSARITAEPLHAARGEGKSLSAIGWEGRIRGVFVFSETLRSEAASALRTCEALGCDVAVLTGDEPSRGRLLAEQLGVPVTAGLMPEAKVAALAEARRAIGPVAMVGDGVNDAPALAASDVGIALGCGADLSRESALVCLLSDDLTQVPWSIELARRSVRVIRQNLFWAFSYNTVGIALAASGWLNPAWAAAAMVASSLLVVTNSLRLQTDCARRARRVRPTPPTKAIGSHGNRRMLRLARTWPRWARHDRTAARLSGRSVGLGPLRRHVRRFCAAHRRAGAALVEQSRSTVRV